MSLKYLRKLEHIDLNQIAIPGVIQNGKLLIRGTEEWDEREKLRGAAGCSCLSYGPVPTVGGKVVW